MDSTKVKEIIGVKKKKTKKGCMRGFYALFSLISDNNLISSNLCIILVILEGFQVQYLPVQGASSEDSAYSWYATITSYINYFNYAVQIQSEIGVLIIILAHYLFLLLLLIASIITICYGVKSKYKQNSLIITLSGFISSSFVLIIKGIIIPLIESFIFPMLCFQGKREGFELSTMTCGSASQIIFSVISGFFIFLVMIIFYVSTKILQDNYWYSTLPWAGELRDMQFIHVFEKILYGIYLGLDLNGTYKAYFLPAFFVLLTFVMWNRLQAAMPYSKSTFLAKLLQESVNLSVYTLAIIQLLYSHVNVLFAQCVAIIVGVICGISAYIHCIERRRYLLMRDCHNIKSIKEAEVYIQSLCSLGFIGEGGMEWKLMLYYMLHVHCLYCKENSCVCKEINLIRKNRHSAEGKENDEKKLSELWLNLCETFIEQQAEKWHTSMQIKLQISYFECIIMKNYYKSYYWLVKAESLRTAPLEKYLIFRMKQILVNGIIMKESKNIGATRVENVIQFQRICNEFQLVLHYCSNVIIAFWSILEMPRLNVNELYQKGQQITFALRCVSETFARATEVNPEYPFNYFYYGHFYRSVLNSEDEGKEWLEKGKDIFKQQHDNRNKYYEDISKSSDSAVLVISGNPETLGIVNMANEHVQSQLGFASTDLLERNISRIMPRNIGEAHDSFLLNNFKSGQGSFLGQEKMVFIQTKYGLMEPICLLVKTLPGLERGMRYIGFIRRDLAKIRQNFLKLPSQFKGLKVAYLVTDNDRILIGLSRHGCSLFGLTKKYIKRKKGLTSAPYSISKLAPELAMEENDHKLETGMEIILHTKTILEYLDYDFLKGNEEENVRNAVASPHEAFVMQLKFNYQNLVQIRAYVVVDLGKYIENRGRHISRLGTNLRASSDADSSDQEENKEIAEDEKSLRMHAQKETRRMDQVRMRF